MSLPLWLVAGYLAGSFPTSFLGGKLAGIDLREHGSKNLGATNVYRVLGLKYAVPVGLIDVAKGAIPVALASRAAGDRAWLPLMVGCAAILGHVFSAFLRFRGGKGVATAAGVVLALASMLGAVAFPISVGVLYPSSTHVFWVGVVLAVFIVFTHRSNIGRLLSGTENRFRRGRKAADGERT
jgi:glycerol-3-phosphate acyltransferase PlsY